MTNPFSKSQVDQLGKRLKKGKIEDDDLRMLDQYRLGHSSADEFVVNSIRENLMLEPTRRSAKSNKSIIEKLKRESIRLTQIQDIAGCRIIVTDIENQNNVVDRVMKLFSDATMVERREKPSHGYRAVHIIVRIQERLIEVQVRTKLQHLWAEISEKLADAFGQEVKYGCGPEMTRNFLDSIFDLVKNREDSEMRLIAMKAELINIEDVELNDETVELHAQFIERYIDLNEASRLVRQTLHKYLEQLENLKR